jgi:putative heme-binding domain-containing protein
MKPFTLTALLFALIAAPLCAQQPEPLWIWHSQRAAAGEVRYFRKELTLDAAPKEATLRVSCDDQATAWVNGEEVGQSPAWKQPIVAKVEKLLRKGQNILAVKGTNEGGSAAMVARLEVVAADGTKITFVSDDTWQSSTTAPAAWNMPGFDAVGWGRPVVLGKLGVGPWGDVFAPGGGKRQAPAAIVTPAEALDTPPGFKVELMLVADKERHGSWVSLAKDDKGRLLLGSQTGEKITRLTLKDGKITNDEDLHLPFAEPMGMLWAFGSLYINGDRKGADGKSGHGIYRLSDTKGDGNYDKIEQIMAWGNRTGGGEHGSHGLVAGPDKKLYVVSGNFTDIPIDISPWSPHRNYADDLILGRAEDGNGFGANRKPPGGFVLRLDPDGKNEELYASGERNTYDIAFNADGELFGFDSDMEWDWGMPWYRPIRVCHLPSAADQGFREGSGKWPAYYPDSLPAMVNIGVGSPTGVVFGTGAKFPAKYQRALYVLDWTYGRLIAVHLQPHGSTYQATSENFVAPKSLHSEPKTPLDLTDAIVGDDGALYFTVGGRGTQAALYRVTYTGEEATTPADSHDVASAEARAKRHELETFHGRPDAKALSFAWPFLGDQDRFLRYAARIAVERQPVAEWRDRATQETNPTAALTALLALARVGGAEAQPALIAALGKIPLAGLSEEDQLTKIRVLEVSVSRDGLPAHAESPVQELDAAYPAKSTHLNRELCQTLIAMGAPDAVEKTMKLLEAAPTQEEQITYIYFLRLAKTGWNPELRKAYFGWFAHRPPSSHSETTLKWFESAGRAYGDGSSFANYIANFHHDATKTLTAQEIDQYQSVLAAFVPPAARKSRQPVKQRPFVKLWAMADLEPDLPKVAHGRNFANGRDCFAAAQCVLCHRFGDEGGAVGPDLTAIASRFSLHDVLESIIDPSKVVSEQYANEEFKLKDGGLALGRIVGETPASITIRPSLLASEIQEVKKASIASQQPSKISPMPPGLMSTLSKEDVLDLLAYLVSAGKEDAPQFAK